MTEEIGESRSGSAPVGSGQRKPHCKLIGTDGSVYAIIGKVRRALEQDGQPDRGREFVERAFASKSYDEVLALCLVYVDGWTTEDGAATLQPSEAWSLSNVGCRHMEVTL